MDLGNYISELALSQKTGLAESEKEVIEQAVKTQSVRVETLTHLPGVYFLLCSNEIVYIGQTNSIHTRLNAHIAEKLF